MLVKNGLTAYYIFNPALWSNVRQLKSRGLIAEQIVDGVLEVYPEIKPVKAHFIDAVNDEPMIEKTIGIIKELKRAGFKIYMFSNIAPETLEQLWNKQGAVGR